MKRKLYIKTYGCQMNVYDTERMAELMAPDGFVVTEEPSDADLVVLNTCHIREKAAEKVYSDIGRMRALKDRRARAGKDMMIAVAGCVAQAEGEEIIRRAPVVDMVVGPQTYHRLPVMVRETTRRRAAGERVRLVETEFTIEEKFARLQRPSDKKGPAAFVTVQEGCDKFCTFCVVPYTRGAEFSRPVAQVVAETERLVRQGVVEITLLGQNVNAFHGEGPDGKVWSLARLIRRLAEIDGLARIRYTTSHPRDMDDDLIAVHAEVETCMPYLHLPIQSGSDRVLAAMNRRHKVDDYRRIIDRLREKRPDLALSGDFIVGFPGETDADFQATMDLVRAVGYAQAYSFKYSARPGTPAAEEADQVGDEVKAERLAALQALLAEQQLAFNRATVGRRLPVLLEKPGRRAGQLVGRSPYMQAVHVMVGNEADAAIGAIVEVAITAAGPHSLEGDIVRASDRPAA
ncbi:MAG: tRNA (N6-isopentenyl adenosine(37)-C2)-methylthiotransferase MiaB [Alphaproteobacteria bacterium]|nr:MAG: tRNA (N6-isopentenyl adenosine(37)-C2)-methylthiotransferase MiaB [Alphaproteobacteria bacterium]